MSTSTKTSHSIERYASERRVNPRIIETALRLCPETKYQQMHENETFSNEDTTKNAIKGLLKKAQQALQQNGKDPDALSQSRRSERSETKTREGERTSRTDQRSSSPRSSRQIATDQATDSCDRASGASIDGGRRSAEKTESSEKPSKWPSTTSDPSIESRSRSRSPTPFDRTDERPHRSSRREPPGKKETVAAFDWETDRYQRRRFGDGKSSPKLYVTVQSSTPEQTKMAIERSYRNWLANFEQTSPSSCPTTLSTEQVVGAQAGSIASFTSYAGENGFDSHHPVPTPAATYTPVYRQSPRYFRGAADSHNSRPASY